MCYFYKLAAAIAVAVGAAHPAAMSHLNLNFSEDKVALSLNVQELTLREITSFKLDTNGDGNISQIEFEDGWAQVDALLRSSLWFEVNGELVYADFTPSDYLGHEGEITNIVLDAEFSIENPNDDFVVHSELFLIEGNPKHKTFISASGFGAENLHYVLTEKEFDYKLKIPSLREVLFSYTYLGFDHVLEGYDHLAFLLALLFGISGLRHLIYAVTAFTLAHSLTLAISALEIFSLPSSFVEPAISISIIAVLVAHLKQGTKESKPAIPAFAFGLLHGFGFAGVLGEIGLASNAKVVSLLGFNLGVELGQLAFILPVGLGVYCARKYLPKISPSTLALPLLAFAIYFVGPYIGIAATLICIYCPWPRNQTQLNLNSLFINSTLIFLAFNAGRWLA